MVSNQGTETAAKVWKFTSNVDRKQLYDAFMNNTSLFTSTYTPVEDRFISIVQDLSYVKEHYPVYHTYIIHTIMNGSIRNKYKDNNVRNGPWYEILAYIAFSHASATARYHQRHSTFARVGIDPMDSQNEINPFWDWKIVLEKIVGDILCHHYMDWYYDFCQPRLEKGNTRYGKFFKALEMTIDYASLLVEDKMRHLMNLYNMDPINYECTDSALGALSIHRDMESEYMKIRFDNINWDITQYTSIS